MRKYQITLNEKQVMQLIAVLGSQSRSSMKKLIRQYNNDFVGIGLSKVDDEIDHTDDVYSKLVDAVATKPNTPINMSVLDVSNNYRIDVLW